MEKSILTQVFLPLALAIIMLGMGLALIPADFRRVIKYPKATFLGLVNQLILLPVLGFALASGFDLKAEHAVGIMLLAACPGGATSNLISNLANGDLALSITLTAVSTLVTIFTIPLIVNFSLGHFTSGSQQIALDIPTTIAQLAVVVLLPISIGMVIRKFKEGFAKRMEKPVKIVSVIFLSLIILAAIIKQREELPAALAAVGPACLALNMGSMLMGFLSARLFRLPLKQRITVSIESGIQNGTLSIGIALGLLLNAEMSVPPAIYSLIMFLTGGIMAGFFGRKKMEEDQEHLA